MDHEKCLQRMNEKLRKRASPGTLQDFETIKNRLLENLHMTESLFGGYRAGIELLVRELEHRQHEDHQAVLIYQFQLGENMRDAEQDGDTATLRHRRSQLLGHLNRVSFGALGRSFHDLCKDANDTLHKERESIVHELDQMARRHLGIPYAKLCSRTGTVRQWLGGLILAICLTTLVLLVTQVWTSKAVESDISQTQRAVQDLDNRVNQQIDIVRYTSPERPNEVIWRDTETGDDIALDILEQEELVVRRFFAEGQWIATDYYEKTEDGQWQKRRVFYENDQEFLRDIYIRSGYFLKKQYDPDGDGIFVERLSHATLYSPFPPGFPYR
jgi:hypothetical protein